MFYISECFYENKYLPVKTKPCYEKVDCRRVFSRTTVMTDLSSLLSQCLSPVLSWCCRVSIGCSAEIIGKLDQSEATDTATVLTPGLQSNTVAAAILLFPLNTTELSSLSDIFQNISLALLFIGESLVF